MPDVDVQIEETLIEHPERSGKWVDGIVATCGNCELAVERAGADTPTNREALLQKLRLMCPYKGDSNRYHLIEE